MAVDLPLAGLRVVETCEEKGELCGRLLADLGADVIKVEPPGGASSRRVPPFAPDGETSLWFAVRNSNKRGVVASSEAEVDALLAGADVWLDSAPASTSRAAAVAAANPRLVVTSITDFGLTGPYRDYVGTDPVIVAASGMLFRSGTPDRPPLLPPGTMAYDIASVTAAFATLTALWQRETTGRGQHVDLSALEAACQTSDWALPNYSVVSKQGLYAEVRAGSGPVYPLYPCADGYVRLIVLSPRQWHSLRAWLGEPETLQDEHWDSLLARMSIQADILDPLYAEFFSDKRMADLADEAQRRGIVMTPVLGPTEILTIPHYKERGTFAEVEVAPGITGPVVASFFELQGERAGFRHRAPTVGEHTGQVDAAAASATAPEPAAPARPFAGLRVLDFGIGGVGVEVGRLFAEYGADVIKVETRTYPDFIRLVALSEMSASFASSSRCKRSFGANAKNERGLEVIKQLVAQSDVLIENSTVGTMADMGLDYDTVKAINPRLVMISSQLMGSAGPWKDWIGYGPSTRPIGGLTYLWNWTDGGMPPGAGVIYPDHLVGRVCAVASVASLLARQRTGAGVHAEVAQVETVMSLLADIFLQDGLTPGAGQPLGNRNPRGAPWGMYQCAGEERWCAITVRDDAEWANLRTALGSPVWAADAKYDTAAGRLADQDAIDDHLSGWTATLTDREVMEALQAHGVPAGLMLYSSDMPTDPQLVARGYPQEVDQPGVGEMLLEGPAFHATGMLEPIVKPAPGLGEHTREIAHELLGLSDDVIDKLIADGALEGPAA
ncbi:MAG TPA: CoA transferase [Acidimicrobiales bacterium]|nr:CoA transferase [Acidimicrobiales bacterium]